MSVTSIGTAIFCLTFSYGYDLAACTAFCLHHPELGKTLTQYTDFFNLLPVKPLSKTEETETPDDNVIYKLNLKDFTCFYQGRCHLKVFLTRFNRTRRVVVANDDPWTFSVMYPLLRVGFYGTAF
jgi:hypothetical protein